MGSANSSLGTIRQQSAGAPGSSDSNGDSYADGQDPPLTEFPTLERLRLWQTGCPKSHAEANAGYEPTPSKRPRTIAFGRRSEPLRYHAEISSQVLLSTTDEAVQHLMAGLSSDSDKVDCLYQFASSLPSLQTSDSHPATIAHYAERVASEKHALLDLFHDMALIAGLKCEVVRGHAKGSTYWRTLDERSSEPNHNWLAVDIDGEWHLIDLLWCVQKKTNFFYLTDPTLFVLTHLPVDPKWQLLQRPITKKEFFAMAFIQPSFVEHGLKVINQLSSRVVSANGTETFKFAYDKSLRSKEFSQTIRLLKPNAKVTSSSGLRFERCVFVEKYNGIVTYTMHFPSAGDYRVEILCRDVGAEGFSAVCAYSIRNLRSGPISRPFPQNNQFHWGPTDEGDSLGLKAISHRQGCIVVDKGAVEVKFSSASSPILHCELTQELSQNADLQDCFLDRYEDSEVIVNVLLPETGYFILRVFVEKEEDANKRQLGCCYLLDCTRPHKGKPSFPYTERLGVQRLRKVLKEAVNRKWPPELRSALAMVGNSKFSTAVSCEAAIAKKMLDQLDRIEGIKKDMLQANRAIISEVRNYNKPPTVIHDIFNAALLLVGDPEVPYAQWPEIQKRCSNSGTAGLGRRVQELRILTVHPELAARSREILGSYDVDSVKRASSSAFLFFVWATDVCKEVLLDLGSSVKPACLTRQREIIDQAKRKERRIG